MTGTMAPARPGQKAAAPLHMPRIYTAARYSRREAAPSYTAAGSTGPQALAAAL